MRGSFFLLTLFITAQLIAQRHPLSKSDSGLILNSLEKYEMLIEKNDPRGASAALNDVAFTYWNNNHYEEAAQYYEKSLILNNQVSNENGIAMINNNLGMLYSDLGQYEKSLECFTKTLAARRSSKEPVGMISGLINMSVVLNNLQRYEESVKLLAEALDIAREMYDKQQMRSVYGMLSETYEKIGDVDRSIQYFQLYKTFHEEIQREEVKSLNKELKEEKLQKQIVEAEKAKKENELLKKELELYQKEQEIQVKDSITAGLYSDLSKNQILVKLLEKEKRLSELEAEAAEQQNVQLKRQSFNLKLIVFIILISASIIFILVFINVGRTKKYAVAMKQKNASIEKQRIELENANHIKNRIFSIISHDLRSPISSLQGLFMILPDFDLEDELKQAFVGIEYQLTNSATLLDNLLTWSKSQIENAPVREEEVEVAPLVQENFNLLKIHAEKKGISLVSDVSTSAILNTDRSMVNIVVRNLIQNAVKFTPKGGSVMVSYENGAADKVIKITDTGVGMDEEKVAKLFDISINRSSAGTDKEVGSGLGLILCKELVEKIHGSIDVTSVLGKGSTFMIKF